MPNKWSLALLLFILCPVLLFGQENFRKFIGLPDQWSDENLEAIALSETQVIALAIADRPTTREQNFALYYFDKATGVLQDSVFHPFLPTHSCPIYTVASNAAGELAVVREINRDTFEFTIYGIDGAEVAKWRNFREPFRGEIGQLLLLDDASVVYTQSSCFDCGGPTDLVRKTVNGEELWRQNSFNSSQNVVYDLLKSPEGDLYVLGSVGDRGSIAKFSPAGELAWEVSPSNVFAGENGEFTRFNKGAFIGPDNDLAIIGTTLFISNLFLRLDSSGEVVGTFNREIGGEINESSLLSSSGDTLILAEISSTSRSHQVFTMNSVLTPLNNLNGQFSGIYKSYLLEGNSLYAATFFPSSPGNNLDIFKYQFTRPGTVAWQIDYGNTDFFNLDYASRAIALPDESFLVVGRLTPDGLSSEQLLFHFNADGTERWRSAFDSGEAEGIYLQDMVLAPNGDVIVNYLKNQSGRSFVARLSQAGEIMWQYELGALSIANPAVRNTIFTLPDGRILAAIFAAEAGRTHQLKFTFLSPDGELLDSQYLVGFTSASSYSVALTENGKILLTGTWRDTQELTAAEYDPETGSLVWSRPLVANPSLRNFVSSLLWEPLSASYFLLSTEIDTVDFGNDLWLTNLAADGTVIRREEIGRTRVGNSRSVMQLTQAGELIVTYSAAFSSTPGPDEYFQYNVEWRNPANYAITAQGSIRNHFGFLGINDVQPVGTDAMLMVGMGESSPRGGWDIMLIRTTQDQLVALRNPGPALALRADLYPNPSTGHTTALIIAPTSSPLYWQLYSAAGQTVAKGTAAAAQEHNISLDLTAQRPGLYLLYARDGLGRSVVQKILLASGE